MDISPEEGLKQVGWSEAEARVYAALHRADEPLTGYQCAKAARVPRPNVYPALERLVRRGAVLEIPDGDGVRYQAVPFGELKTGMVRHVARLLDDVGRALDHQPVRPRVAVSRGTDALRQQALALITDARRTLDVGASAGTVPPYREELDAARARGVAITYYCFDRCPAPGCGTCINPLPLSAGPFEVHGWLTLVADQATVLMATNIGHDPDVLVTDLPPLTETLRTLFSRLSLVAGTPVPHDEKGPGRSAEATTPDPQTPIT